jgi:uncharacterized cupin superfamily protein
VVELADRLCRRSWEFASGAGAPRDHRRSDRMAPVIDVRRAAERFSTRTEWLASRHSFSFGEHYDPANVGFAALVAHNDDVVAVGAGYDTHPHADTEIVTWVLEGSLVHLDSRGGSHVLGPGSVQLLSAGSGVLHSFHLDVLHRLVPVGSPVRVSGSPRWLLL